MARWRHGLVLGMVIGVLSVAAAARAQGITAMKKGEGGSAVQGSSGPSGSQGAASDLERCDKPMGAVAVVDPRTRSSTRCRATSSARRSDSSVS